MAWSASLIRQETNCLRVLVASAENAETNMRGSLFFRAGSVTRAERNRAPGRMPKREDGDQGTSPDKRPFRRHEAYGLPKVAQLVAHCKTLYHSQMQRVKCNFGEFATFAAQHDKAWRPSYIGDRRSGNEAIRLCRIPAACSSRPEKVKRNPCSTEHGFRLTYFRFVSID